MKTLKSILNLLLSVIISISILISFCLINEKIYNKSDLNMDILFLIWFSLTIIVIYKFQK